MSRVSMLQSFIAFHVNGVSNIIYLITHNFWIFLIIFGLFGTILLNLKEEVDMSHNEEQNII